MSLDAAPAQAAAPSKESGSAPATVAIKDLAAHVGKEVTLRGWLYNKRSSKKLHFLEVRDGSGIAQCVVFVGDVTPELFAAADHLAQETSLEVVGLVKEHGKIAG